MKSIQSRNAAKGTAEKEDRKLSITAIANGNWARKDSNVLWSAYFTEDDLKSQFSRKPSQMSRIFSVGTLDSGIDPLENEAKDIVPPPVHSTDADVRNRVVYSKEGIPTKSLRETGYSGDFEDINIRDFALERRCAARTEPPSLQEMLDHPFLGRNSSVTVC